MFSIIFNSKSFQVPSDSHFLRKINPFIAQQLNIEGHYEVISKVKENIFISFMNYLIDGIIPDLNTGNISEFEEISNEFEVMDNLVQIFQNAIANENTRALFSKNYEIKKKLSTRKDNLLQKNTTYHQIINIIFNPDRIHSFTHYLKLKRKIYDKCNKEDVESIDLMTRKHVFRNGLKYYLNEKEKTAGLYKNKNTKAKHIMIPKTITFNSKKYLVTEIFKGGFNFSKAIYSIQFSEDSQLRVIENSSFTFSSIVTLFIPASVVKLEDGWCNGVEKLKNIFVHPDNPHFIYYEEQFILGKTDEKSEIYDELLFARRDVENANIPSFIKRIGPYAFERCSQLTEVTFPSESNIEILDKYSFCETSIESILIPSNVFEIRDGCFSHCDNLSAVLFRKNSKLQKIGKFAFQNSSIKSIKIPATVTEIEELAFANCEGLKKVDIPVNSQLKSIGNEAFTYTSIDSFFIPSSIERLDDFWCKGINLTKITISPQNKRYLYMDNKYILSKNDEKSDNYDTLICVRRDIQRAIIPSFIRRIAPFAFGNCEQLLNVDFSEDSELQIIDSYAFFQSSLTSLSIPPNVVKINDNCFNSCYSFTKIEFPSDSKLQVIGPFAFSSCSIEQILIPSSVIQIEDGAFNACLNLKSIDFERDSKIECFNDDIFSESSIECISIPSSICKFSEKWCHMTNTLDNIFMQKNPHFIYHNEQFILGKTDEKSEIYDDLLFARRDIENANIPPFIKRIGPYAFERCSQLTEVTFPSESNIEILDKYSFCETSIESILIPSNVFEIRDGCFSHCDNLRKVKFQDNSKLRYIGQNAFAGTKIEEILIPSNVVQIRDKAFFGCSKIKLVQFENDSQLQIIGEFAFAGSSLKSFVVPSSVIFIGNKAFDTQNFFMIVEIQENTKLQIDTERLFGRYKYALIMISRNQEESIIEKKNYVDDD